MPAYLLDEHLILISETQLYIWNENISSHQELEHYQHRFYDLKTQRSFSLSPNILLPAPDISELYADLPEELQRALKAQLADIKPPPRLPRQVWYCDNHQKIVLEYLWQAPKTVLRIIDLETVMTQTESIPGTSLDHQDHHFTDLNIRALSEDGKTFFASDYPENQKFILQNIGQEKAMLTKPWPLEKALYQPGATCAQNLWWVGLQTGRKYQVIAIDQTGQMVHQIKIKGRPEKMRTNCKRDTLVLGTGNSEILVLYIDSTGITTHKIKYPQAKVKDNALKCKLSPDGRYLAVRGSMDQILSVIKMDDHSLVYQQPLEITEVPLENGGLLLKLPDFVLTNDSMITVQNGTIINKKIDQTD